MDAPIAIVTGGANGLGRAVSLELAGRGHAVTVADVDETGAREVALACSAAGVQGVAIGVDLASDEGPRRMVEETVAARGRLDVLVNCAAVAPVEPFLEMSAQAWRRVLDVNVRAVALAMAAAGEAMARSGGGRIINVTSAAARMALPGYAAYAAAKAAVDSLTRAGAVALAPRGVLVNSVSPGMMDTALQAESEAALCRLEGRDDLEAFERERTARIPLGRRTTPQEMAAVIGWMATEAPAYMTAERLNVSGGLDRD